MKILVDKMPESPEECPYSLLFREGSNYTCSKRITTCISTKECPVFTEFVRVKREVHEEGREY